MTTIVWFATAALARSPSIGFLEMPLTPWNGQEPYVGVVDVADADATTWTADADRFVCSGLDDYLAVEVDPGDWPSVVPKRVRCYGDDGRKASIKVDLRDERRRAMFVGDGTLVMPREKRAPVIYDGAPPRDDLVVQQGHSERLILQCGIEVGLKLRVVVDAETKDGEGACILRTRHGGERAGEDLDCDPEINY